MRPRPPSSASTLTPPAPPRSYPDDDSGHEVIWEAAPRHQLQLKRAQPGPAPLDSTKWPKHLADQGMTKAIPVSSKPGTKTHAGVDVEGLYDTETVALFAELDPTVMAVAHSAEGRDLTVWVGGKSTTCSKLLLMGRSPLFQACLEPGAENGLQLGPLLRSGEDIAISTAAAPRARKGAPRGGAAAAADDNDESAGLDAGACDSLLAAAAGTGEAAVSLSFLPALLRAAARLQFADATNALLRYCLERLTPASWYFYVRLARREKIKPLTNSLMVYARFRIELISRLDGFTGLDWGEMKRILNADPNPSDAPRAERTAMHRAAAAWVRAQRGVRNKRMRAILELIDLNELPGEYIVQQMADEAVRQDDVCVKMFQDAARNAFLRADYDPALELDNPRTEAARTAAAGGPSYGNATAQARVGDASPRGAGGGGFRSAASAASAPAALTTAAPPRPVTFTPATKFGDGRPAELTALPEIPGASAAGLGEGGEEAFMDDDGNYYIDDVGLLRGARPDGADRDGATLVSQADTNKTKDTYYGATQWSRGPRDRQKQWEWAGGARMTWDV